MLYGSYFGKPYFGGSYFGIGQFSVLLTGQQVTAGFTNLTDYAWVNNLRFVGVLPAQGSNATEVASGNLTLAEPSGSTEGDLLVAGIAYRSTAAFTVPSGWAAAATQQSTGDTVTTTGGGRGSGLLAYIVRGASAPSFVFTRTAGDVAQGAVACYRCAPGYTWSYDTGVSATMAANGTTVSVGGFTAAAAGELLVMLGAGGDNLTFSAYSSTSTKIQAFTQRFQDNTSTGADTTLALADAIQASAVTTGTLQYTATGSDRNVIAVGGFYPSVAVGAVTLTGFAGSGAYGTLTPNFTIAL